MIKINYFMVVISFFSFIGNIWAQSDGGNPSHERYALLIGVSRYEHGRMNSPPLRYPEADCDAVAKLLQSCGYKVKNLTGREATKAKVANELKKLESQGTSEGGVIVCLFGHGVQYGNLAYFAPYDTKVRAYKDSAGKNLRDELTGQPLLEPDPGSMVAMRSVLDSLAISGGGSRLLLADCCREDPNRARGRAFGASSISVLPKDTAAIFACSQSEKAFEHKDWNHGAFTYSLLKRLRHVLETKNTKLVASTLAVDLKNDVAKLVASKGETQTVNMIANGIIELPLGVETIERVVKPVVNATGVEAGMAWVGPMTIPENATYELHLGITRVTGDEVEGLLYLPHSNEARTGRYRWLEGRIEFLGTFSNCLLYTSDAADE